LSEERIIRTDIFIKKQKEFSLDELKEIVFQIGDSGRIISNSDVSNIPLSINIDFKILN
jgi:hypothetical protein